MSSSSQPRFDASVIDAYNELARLESPNDFLVGGFQSAGDKLLLSLVAKGKGGMGAVKQVLESQFQSEVGVALFRVTAVDQRGLTISRRTKLVHVIFTGPKTPVMTRAKVASYNSALKQPFTFNLAIQTDNCADDLTEAGIERALRASGGAHQPTEFDFDNGASEQDSLAARERPLAAVKSSDSGGTFAPISTSAPPSPSRAGMALLTPSRRTPGGNEKFLSVLERYQSSFVENEAQQLCELYDDTASTLIHTSVATEATARHSGKAEIATWYNANLPRLVPGYRQLSCIKLQPDPEQSSEGVAYLHWASEAVSFACETILVVGGVIIAHTICVDLEAETEREDGVGPLKSDWPGGSTTASFGDHTASLDDPSTDGGAEESDEEDERASVPASTNVEPGDEDSQAPTLLSADADNDSLAASAPHSVSKEPNEAGDLDSQEALVSVDDDSRAGASVE